MAKPHREWWIATAVIIAATIFRAGVFVFWERSHFDSDQAVMGLMAKHLIEGRAFPVYFYGQFYILGVEAWLAAPVFALFGPSVTALKLPLLAINIAVAVLLLRGFTREVGLRPLVAVVPTLFFALPAPGTAARFVAPDGGNVEPIFYGLLLWLLRHRPVWSGLVLGIGFLHREFTIYPFVAIVLIQAVRRDLFTRSILIRTAVVVAVAAVVWIGVQGLRRVSSAAGPHTTIANVRGAPNNVGELLQRTCVDPTTMASGVRRIVTEHWPQLFGASLIPLAGFSIVNEGINQGTAVSGILLATIVALAVGMVIAGAPRARGLGIPRHHDFCAFLVLASALSVAGYVVGRCGYIEFGFMRYEL